ncbi:MAG: hypothetical protein ACR2P1_28875 [Pseudomonadales bacterium]
MWRQLFIVIFLILSLPACDLIYPQRAEPAPEVEASTAKPAAVDINPRVERPMSPRPVLGGVCQDNPAIRLLASGQYEPAHALLQKEVQKEARAQPQAAQQYCNYLGLNLLHLLSASPYFNLANAVKYQNRLQALIDEGVSDEQGLLLSKALNEVMLQHTANSRLQTDIAELRTELKQKEDAIQRLKELTMEETGS